MNNKGFTVIELILSFAFVSALTVSLFALVINYKDKEKETTQKASINNYSNMLTSLIEKDIETKILKNANYCEMSGTTIFKCVELHFQDGTTKRLQVVNEEKSISIYSSNFNYLKYYIVYDDVVYPVPGEGVIEVRADSMLTKTSNTDALENNLGIYKFNISFYYKDINMGADINIVAVGEGYRNTGTGPYRALSMGQQVNVNLCTSMCSYNNVAFHVLKDSDSFSPYVLLLADTNYGTSALYSDPSASSSFVNSNIYFRLTDLYNSWNALESRDDIRIITANEVSMLTNSSLSAILYDANTSIDLGITNTSTSRFLNLVDKYWTSSNYLTQNILDSAWAFDNGRLVKTLMSENLKIRPVIKINKSYLLA